MVTELTFAQGEPVEPFQLPRLLTGARTPLDALCALAEDGAAAGFDVWALATVWQGVPWMYLASLAPLPAATAAGQLAHFTAAAADMPCEGDRLLPDWSQARQQVVCLKPQLPALEQDLSEYRDLHVHTGEPTGFIIRAATLQGPGEERRVAPWERLPMMVQYLTPHLRTMHLSATDSARGMIDVESGVYSWSFFLDAIQREVERSQRSDTDLSVAVLQLQPLQALGQLGPEVQRRVAAHVLANVRRTDVVGRIGRTSYAVFFHNTGPRPALIAAGRIADAMNLDETVRSALSFSLGVAGKDNPGPVDVEVLLEQAADAASEAARVAPNSAFVYI